MKRIQIVKALAAGMTTALCTMACTVCAHAMTPQEVLPSEVPEAVEVAETVEAVEVPEIVEVTEVVAHTEAVAVPEPVEATVAEEIVSEQPALARQEDAGWKKDRHGWWYRESDGSWPAACWKQIRDRWYYFDAQGYMQTGWIRKGGKWYYLDKNGVMQTGWVRVSGKWYYLNPKGVMQTGWIKDGSKWYYLNKNGEMKTGWVRSGARWYYLNKKGVMQTGWIRLSDKWYYLEKSGAMLSLTSRVIGDKRYMFDDSGRMTAEMPVNLSDEEIWNVLNTWLGNGYGVAGLMGNLYAESGLRSDNLENIYNRQFDVTDEAYTEQVDSGKRSFIDSAGYGLAQWTFRTRKQNLYDLARSQETSVADPYMQLEFLRQEIEGNAALYELLQSAQSVRETSDAVLTRYERPADQSDAVKEKRAALGTGYLERFMP